MALNDIRILNTEIITKIIKYIRSLMIPRQRLSKEKKEICKLQNKYCKIISNRQEIMKIGEELSKKLNFTDKQRNSPREDKRINLVAISYYKFYKQ